MTYWFILETQQFQNIGPLSGYKLNIEKTEIVTYNYYPLANIKNTYSLKGHTKLCKYLGIHLTKDYWLKSVDPLTVKIRKDLNRWNWIPFFSFSSRMEPIQMNMLLTFLYLFRYLPVEITAKQFIEWDQMFSRFIWQGKSQEYVLRPCSCQRIKKGGLVLH